MTAQRKEKSFREAFVELVARQYLPFSLIQEKAFEDCLVAFHKEWIKHKKQPVFVTDKTVANDIHAMADTYIAEMKTRFDSKLSLCMDVWTGPNKMSFLGITFTYLDENFTIQRGLLEMIKMKKKHTGEYIATLFKQAISLYGIEKGMIGGITQDNAANCGTCTEALVREDGFSPQIFYGCFLHVLNLASQAALKVYDSSKKKKNVKKRKIQMLGENEDSTDDEDDPESEFDQYEEELKDVHTDSFAISNARNLVVFINRNDLRRESFARSQRACKLNETGLVKDMKVRWNTTYDMIESLIRNETALNLLPRIDSEVQWPLLTQNDWNELKEVAPLLEKFKKLTLYFSQTTECQMSAVGLLFEKLLTDIKKEFVDKGVDEISNLLYKAANAAYSTLAKYYEKIDSENFLLATVLDPRFKLDGYRSTAHYEILRKVAEEAMKKTIELYSKKYSEDNSQDNSQNSPHVLSGLCLEKLGPQDELASYLKEGRAYAVDDPLAYWRDQKSRFPILARMARDYLALQPTSKDVEGTFSKRRRTIPYYIRAQNAITIRNQMLVNSGIKLAVFK